MIVGLAGILASGTATTWLATRADAAVTPGTIKGTAYRDYNANGVRDGGEPGQAGISVRAFDSASTLVASATTGPDGSYALAVANAASVRVEFNSLPSYLTSGPHGADSGTSVQFTASPAEEIDYAVLNPAEYCQTNPDLITNCAAVAVAAPSTHVLVKLAAGDGSRTPGTPSPGAAQTLANAGQVGATWGLGFDASTRSVFSAAFVKRHTLLGPGGPGGIYRTQPGPDNAFGGADDVTTLYATVGNAGTNPHPGVYTGSAPAGDWLLDADGFRAVGKVGLGDLDVAEDGSAIYTVNLNTASLVRIPIAATAPAPGAGVPIPAPAGCVAPRPFGLAVHDGFVYVGGVCSAEGATAAALSAYVYRYDPVSGGFDPSAVLTFPLTYPRGCGDRQIDALGNSTSDTPGLAATICPNHRGEWQPWTSAATELAASRATVFAEPMLSDIVFDHGAMAIGIRDRHGDQMGSENGTKDLAGLFAGGNAGSFGISAGDILRACPTSTGWAIEDNASCGGVTTPGDKNQQGPGGGEYYYGDYHRSVGEQATPPVVNGDGGHDEISVGGLAQIPGRPNLSYTSITPIQGGPETWSQGGVTWVSNATGASTGAYKVYDANPDVVFGKAAGLGDLEALCDAAPIEIGNRVWIDANRNGVQDPGEAPIAGVVVTLVSPDGSTRTATTDATGSYYFVVTPNTRYTVQIATGQAPLAGLVPTSTASGTNRRIDSNGEPNTAGTIVSTVVTSGRPGANDHTLDFGFNARATTPPTTVGTPTPPVTVVGKPVPPKLQLVKAAPKSIEAGQVFTYRITVSVPKSAKTAARGVTIRDVLPRGLTLAQKQATALVVKQGVVSWNVGTVKPGASKTVLLRVRSIRTMCKPITNVARASGTNTAARVTASATTKVTCIKAVEPPVVAG